MKIKSITDVITNSSSEVFTLTTNKTSEEVYQWLKENIKWNWAVKPNYDPFNKPELMEKGEGILEWLSGFGYVWDSHNLDDVENYKIAHCLNYATSYYDGENDFIVKRYGRIVKTHWEKFCRNNMAEILSFFPNFSEDDFWNKYYLSLRLYDSYLYPVNEWTHKYDDLIKKFILYYEEECPNYIPTWWSIPKELDIQYWKNKIGFSTSDENSISYDDMQKIINEFGGVHWHMG